MKIKFLKLVDQYKPGDIAEVSDSLASKLLWRKMAEKAPDEPEVVVVETATIEPKAETAAVRTQPPRRTSPKA